jgi:hypothetical protein
MHVKLRLGGPLHPLGLSPWPSHLPGCDGHFCSRRANAARPDHSGGCRRSDYLLVHDVRLLSAPYRRLMIECQTKTRPTRTVLIKRGTLKPRSPLHDSRKPAGEFGICGLSCAGRSWPPHARGARRRWSREKAGGRYTVGFSLRLPARSPVPLRLIAVQAMESKPAKSKSRCRVAPRNITGRILSEQLCSDSLLDHREGPI